MEVRLLGPVLVIAAGQLIDVGPPQRCAVLAALAVDAGRLVTVETLIDRVWGDEPSERARRGLHAHVARIRRMLEQCGAGEENPVRLMRRTGGYVLELDPDRVDLHRFRRLVEQARDVSRTDVSRTDVARADGETVTLLREALALWHGEPLAGLTGIWVNRARQGWRQQHLDAMLAWAAAELRVDNPTAAVASLSDLLAEHPFHEPLVAVAMRALYAAGHAAEALDLYTVTRDRLVEELGAEPGIELRRIQQGILRDDLDRQDEHDQPPTAPPARPSAAPVVPAQLPRNVRGFTGRQTALVELDALVAASGEAANAVVISAVAGTAGVGKTALAVHWAHRVADRFPDGQLYANLRGFDPAGSVMDPAEAVRRFLDALGVPAERIPADPEAQAALYRSELVGRRMLILLDNARDTTQVRPLLPGAPTCLVLATSRSQLSGLVAAHGAYHINLALLSVGEARDLLARRLGPDRIATAPEAIEEIITRCARLPLALAVVAARAAIHPHLPLTALAGELRDSRERLDALVGDDPYSDLRAVFSWSYHALTPDAARLFRLLGLHTGPDLSAPAAASLAALPVPRAAALLAELARVNLIVEHDPGRYTFHDLLRAYATDLAHAIDPDAPRRAGSHRMLDHYLHTAHTADQLLGSDPEPITLTSAQPGVTPEPLADHDQALAWFTAERPVLLAAINHAAATGFDTHAWKLAWTLGEFLDRRGHWHDWATAGLVAVAAAHRQPEPGVQARAHRALAAIYLRLSREDDAHTELRHALDLYERAGDQAGQAHTHRSLGHLRERQGRYTEALEHGQRVFDLYVAAGHRHGQANALNGIGWYHALRGDYSETLSYCQQALTLLQELGNRVGQAATWDSLGYAHHQLGQHTQAIACYQHAVDLLRDLGDRYHEAAVLHHIGDTHHAAGSRDAARGTWRQALAIFDNLEHPEADEIRIKLEAP